MAGPGGTLDIRNDAEVGCSEAKVGVGTIGLVKVAAGSIFTCGGPLTLGVESGSRGKLEVGVDGVANIAGADVGLDGFGEVDIAGGGMQMGGDLTIGIRANGIVTTRTGSFLGAPNIFVGGAGNLAGGSNGGSLVVGRDCRIEASDETNIGVELAFGIATVQNLGELASPIVRVGALGNLIVERLGSVRGIPLFPKGSTQKALAEMIVDGELRIARASDEDELDPGPAMIDGNLAIGPEALVTIEVDDPSIPALEVLGATTLSGELLVEIPTDLVLAENQQLQLIEFTGGVTGAFSSVSFPVAPEGFEGSVDLVEGVVRLTVVDPGIPSGGEGEGEGEGQGEGEGCGAGVNIPLDPPSKGDWNGDPPSRGDFAAGDVLAIACAGLLLAMSRRWVRRA